MRLRGQFTRHYCTRQIKSPPWTGIALGRASDPAYRRVDVDVETGKVRGLF